MVVGPGTRRRVELERDKQRNDEESEHLKDPSDAATGSGWPPTRLPALKRAGKL
ncbi:hypothetical protein [Streptomyces sp. NPDC048637]|uniref:hypothetical protein n=1 Tax=Streptomyces sp. NPDC048637 TaxID=3155636 RepID=UPI00343F391C